MSKPLDIKGRIALANDMKAAIKEITDLIDLEYKVLRDIKSLEAPTDSDKTAPLCSFLEFHLFVLLLNADIITLFHQFLGTSQPYVKKYCAGKMYTTYQEGFKKLYGFYDKEGKLKPNNSKWKVFKNVVDLLPQGYQEGYTEIGSSLSAASRTIANMEWKTIRDAEDHVDAVKIIEFRRSVNDENKVIKDAVELLECLKRVSHYCTGIYALLSTKTS